MSKPPIKIRITCLLKGHNWDGENALCRRCRRWDKRLVKQGKVDSKYPDWAWRR